MQTTWIQIMRFARALDEGRRTGQGIDVRDADQLVSMLLDFQRRALHERPTLPPEAPAVPNKRAG